MGINLNRDNVNALYRDPNTKTDMSFTVMSICTIDEQTFKGFTELQTLNLANNYLTSLPINLFADLTSLNTLDLSNNEFFYFNQTILSGLTRLVKLKIGGNPIVGADPTFVKNLCKVNGLQSCTVET
jgi:hypothetical protein